MTNHQQAVVEALKRIYHDGVKVMEILEDKILNVMVVEEEVVIISIDVPEHPDPDRVDVGDRVHFKINSHYGYGIVCIYNDVGRTVGVVPEGCDKLFWYYADDVDVVASGD